MSHQATTWVLERSEQDGRDFIVLFVIANHCNPDGSGAFPSIKRIAAQARISERGARYAIESLEKSGELTVERSKGATPDHEWHSRNDYTIPGVIRDGFYRERLPRPEATGAAGKLEPSGKPKGKASGNELPLNNPLEQIQEQEVTAPQIGALCHVCGLSGRHHCKGRPRKHRDSREPRYQKERTSYVKEIATRSPAETRRDRTAEALKVLGHPERLPEDVRRAIAAK